MTNLLPVSRLLLVALYCSAPVLAGERAAWDPFTRDLALPDLTFPQQAELLDRSLGTHLFKPEGQGPFPALVLMPTCGGIAMSVWAEEALRRGYVVLKIDPLTPRNIETNCDVVRVRMARLLKDAFDGAAHLRRLPIVKPDRIGLFGFSQGGFVGLGASGEAHARERGQPAFAAIMSAFPSCRIPDVVHPDTGEHVDIVYAPQRVLVPLLVEVGGRDRTTGLPRNGCDSAFDNAFMHGDPVKVVTYSAGHKWDQDGPAEVTRQSIQDAFEFTDQHLQ